MYLLSVYICSFIIEKIEIEQYKALLEKFRLHQKSIDKALFDLTIN